MNLLELKQKFETGLAAVNTLLEMVPEDADIETAARAKAVVEPAKNAAVKKYKPRAPKAEGSMTYQQCLQKVILTLPREFSSNQAADAVRQIPEFAHAASYVGQPLTLEFEAGRLTREKKEGVKGYLYIKHDRYAELIKGN
jgi:hypothetical protein